MTSRQRAGAALALLLGAGAVSAVAQDAVRGAGLYLQLPGVPSCVSCHGPDLLANRNGFLRAADNPQALQKALNAVSAMGYLKAVLSDADVVDLAAFLGRVAILASGEAALQVWPLSADFGRLSFGTVSGPQVIRVGNVGLLPLSLQSPRWQGAAGFSLEHDCPTRLEAGDTCSVNLRFQALALGNAAGALVLGSEATPRPVLAALGASTSAQAHAVLQWQGAASQIRFDSTALGGTQAIRMVLVNAGARTAVLGSTSLIGPQSQQFSASGCPAGSSLEPSASCEITLRYARSSPAAADATLQMRTDGANPPSLALRADASPTTASAPSPNAVAQADSGGGASSPGWLAGLAVAVLALAGGQLTFRLRRRSNPGK